MNNRNCLPDFNNSFSRSLTISVVKSPAFMALSSAAKAVCIVCYCKNDNAKFHRRKTENGKPVFPFTAVESKRLLNISNKTHSTALSQLVLYGLIDLHTPGGLKGANGIASLYTLSKRWRDWTPTLEHNGRQNMAKARLALGRKELEPVKTPALVAQTEPVKIASVVQDKFQPGQRIYFRHEPGQRALKGDLIMQDGDNWKIRGMRTATKITPPIFIISADRILTVDEVRGPSLQASKQVKRSSHEPVKRSSHEATK